LRYSDQDGPRSNLYVVDVIHGSRDLEAYFVAQPEEEEC